MTKQITMNSELRQQLLDAVRADDVWSQLDVDDRLIELLQEQETPNGHVLQPTDGSDRLLVALVELYEL